MSESTLLPCDHTRVGALISNSEGSFLTIQRTTHPVGIAGPARHIDDHGGPQQAIEAHVRGGIGLTVMDSRLLARVYRPGACRRPGGNLGHDWWLWLIRAQGRLLRSLRETGDARWRSPQELQELTDRTCAYGRGEISVEQFQAEPGIEPAWVDLLAVAGIVMVSVDDKYRVDQLLRGQCVDDTALADVVAVAEQQTLGAWTAARGMRDNGPDSECDRLRRAAGLLGSAYDQIRSASALVGAPQAPVADL